MASILFKQSQCLYLLFKRSKAAGFTLLELLVALIVGGIITSALLFLVIQLIETNQREAARSDTQRDLQMALDYIARDVREAVYVYDGNCLDRRANYQPQQDCPGLKNYLPSSIAGSSATNNVPVLAFWRVDALPETLMNRCISNAAAFSAQNATLPAAIQGVPCLSRRMYTLVVYSLNWEQRTGVRGRARIMRYELPQFSRSSANSAGAPIVTDGWFDPTKRDTNFYMWPLDTSTLGDASPKSLQSTPPTATFNANHLILVDYVDRRGIYNIAPDGTATLGKAACPSTPDRIVASNMTVTQDTGYVLTPRDAAQAADDPPRGFYVCVKGGESQGVTNQEVVIRIQGDAAGRPGLPNNDLTRPLVPISLETRVLTRGVLNKTD